MKRTIIIVLSKFLIDLVKWLNGQSGCFRHQGPRFKSSSHQLFCNNIYLLLTTEMTKKEAGIQWKNFWAQKSKFIPSKRKRVASWLKEKKMKTQIPNICLIVVWDAIKKKKVELTYPRLGKAPPNNNKVKRWCYKTFF